MPSRSLEGCELWSTIQNDAFGSIPEEDLVRQVEGAFREETKRLKCASAAERSTPPLIMLNDAHLPPTPSQLLFGEDFDEVNRTYLGVLALRWLLTGNYRKFIQGQQEEAKLSEESFKWLKGYYEENLRSHQDLFALLLSMVVNDLGKDPNLAEDYYRKTKFPIYGSNHDVVLLEAARQGMVPCLDYLDESHQQDIMLGLELGSELNAGQLAQAENVPVNLEGLLNMRNHEHAFNMKFMEQILDVAGAAGHVFADGAKNLIEPVFQAFKTVLDVSLSIVRGESTLKEGYNLVLSKRAKLLENEGFRPLSVDNQEQRALLRLLTMGRTATYEQAKLFDDAFQALESVQRERLISGLNIDAIDDDETAVIPYYMPAMIAETIKNTQDSGKEQEALTSLLRYLARTLHWTAEDEHAAVPTMLSTLKEEKAATWPPTLHIPVNTGRVYERNMTKARETISSPQFKQDPSVLDKLDTPEGYLLQRRRTSQSA